MSRRTQDPAGPCDDFAYRACTFFGWAFNPIRLSSFVTLSRSFNPGPQTGLGFSPFARRYSGNHCCFLFLRVLRCFSSPGTSHTAMYSPHDDSSSSCRVPPFGYRRVFASLQLAGAFRSLARPSSVSSGKASSVRPSLLNQWFSSFFFSRVFTRCFIKNCFNCFLSVIFNFRFRPFCYVFMLFSFQRPILLRNLYDPSKLNKTS